LYRIETKATNVGSDYFVAALLVEMQWL